MSAFEEGKQAYREGKELRDCPYAPGSEEELDWEGGWMIAGEDLTAVD